MKPRSTLQGDVNRRTTSSAWGGGHDARSFKVQARCVAQTNRIILAHVARQQPASVAEIPNRGVLRPPPRVNSGPDDLTTGEASESAGYEDCNNSNDFLKDSDPAVDYQTR